MASYNANEFFKKLRERKKMLLKETAYFNTEMTVSRVEKGKSKPYKKTRENLMNTLQLPEETFFCPYLDNQPIEAYNMKDAVNLLYEIEKGLALLPKDNSEKEEKLMEILFTTASVLVEAGLIDQALTAIEKGNKIAVSKSSNLHKNYSPGFMYLKAKCLLNTEKRDKT